ncbi:MAG: zinc ribbon domain-containing protein, partial [Eubacterium sp.]|nr:zinc ribbon domain-containing protein [Eubacterium sp.]
MANFCSNCGTRLGEGARFCPNCGQKIGDSPDRNEPIRNNAPTAPVIEPKKAASGNGNRAAKPFGNANRAAKSYGKNRSAKKKKSRLSLVLAVIMAVEFLIAG